MLQTRNTIKVLFLLFVILAFARNANAAPIDPFEYFNVYSLNDIGTAGDVYNTDIEGTMGAGGNAYFGSFGAPNLVGNEYVLHTGGDVTLGGGTFIGNLDVGGNLDLHNTTYSSTANVGGDAKFYSGVLAGNINAAGSITDCYSAGGCSNATGGVAYSPMFDFTSLNQYFLDTSSDIGAMDVTGTTSAYYGTVTFNATSGINVFNINATDLYSTMNRIIINGPSDAVVYINALEASAHLGKYMNWIYNGVDAHNVLLNFENATDLTILGGHINVLAPLADIDYTTGAITGNLIAGNLFGGAQVNVGFFTPPVAPIPEPATIVLLGIGFAGLVGFRKKFVK